MKKIFFVLLLLISVGPLFLCANNEAELKRQLEVAREQLKSSQEQLKASQAACLKEKQIVEKHTQERDAALVQLAGRHWSTTNITIVSGAMVLITFIASFAWYKIKQLSYE